MSWAAEMDLIPCHKCPNQEALLFSQMEENGTWKPYIHCKSCFQVYFIDRRSIQ